MILWGRDYPEVTIDRLLSLDDIEAGSGVVVGRVFIAHYSHGPYAAETVPNGINRFILLTDATWHNAYHGTRHREQWFHSLPELIDCLFASGKI